MKVSEGSASICDYMGGTWGHYAKWKKADTEGMLYDFTLELSKIVPLLEAESRMVAARVGEKANRGSCHSKV